MQAAIFHGDKKISIGTLARPQPVPGEVLVRVRHTALCGSDTRLWLSGAACTPGHEIFGVVEQPEHSLHARRCLVYIPVHCGQCASCRQGDTHMCLNESVLVGWNRPGGYSEYLTVPEQCLLEVPEDIEDELAPLLLDTIGTAAHGMRFAGHLTPPQTCGPALVIGAGPVGLGALLSLQGMGYQEVYVAELKESRLHLAESFGAQRYTAEHSRQRFKLIVECTGSHAARTHAMENVLPRGVLLLLGENDKPWPVRENRATRRKDFHMVRTFYFPKSDFPANVELLRKDRARYRKLIDAQFGLDVLPQMYARFAAGELIKPLLSFA